MAPRLHRARKAVVVGLDGVPHSLVRRLSDEGVTPRLAQLAAAGHLVPMTVTLPEISAVSWPSFATGVGPGGHGVFGFTDLKPASYDLRFTNAADVKAPTLWERLGRVGKRAVVINQPGTYPARAINGVMVAGFVAVDFDRAITPPALRPRLRALGYEIDVDTVKCRTDHELLRKQLLSTLDGRRAAARWLWEHERWDYFELVVTGTDRLHHYMWDALADAGHPQHQFCLDYYAAVDALVGEFYDRAQADGAAFFLVSDHGFCACEVEVFLSRWLEQEGYLALEKADQPTLAALGAGSRVFALDPNPLYLNLAGKYPRGCVRPGEGPALAAELKAKLLALTYKGRPVIRRVFGRDEIYEGPYAAAGPDLVAVAHNGFDLKAHLGKPAVFAATDLTGMHTYDDALFWSREAPPPDMHITRCAGMIWGEMS
jgi:predicted AlkP superfamily phosphohydrolase/phosphomutase